MRTWTTRCSLAVLFGLATTAARADPLVILTTSVPPATARTTYVQTLQASGGTQPYVWSVSSGDLPLGIALVPCGDLAGSAGSDGDFSFTVRVSDASGQFAQRPLSLNVHYNMVNILTNSLPPARVGVPYSVSLSASGGWPPYTFWPAATPWPGINFDPATGTLSGVPSEIGTQGLTFMVEGAYEGIGHRDLQLTVNSAAPAINLIVDGMHAPDKWEQGVTLWQNANDNNQNGIPDYQELGAVQGEVDLLPVQIFVQPVQLSGVLALSVDPPMPQTLKLWTTAEKGAQIPLPVTWNLPGQRPPSVLWLEAVTEGSDVPVRLTLTYLSGADGGTPLPDGGTLLPDGGTPASLVDYVLVNVPPTVGTTDEVLIGEPDESDLPSVGHFADFDINGSGPCDTGDIWPVDDSSGPGFGAEADAFDINSFTSSTITPTVDHLGPVQYAREKGGSVKIVSKEDKARFDPIELKKVEKASYVTDKMFANDDTSKVTLETFAAEVDIKGSKDWHGMTCFILLQDTTTKDRQFVFFQYVLDGTELKLTHGETTKVYKPKKIPAFDYEPSDGIAWGGDRKKQVAVVDTPGLGRAADGEKLSIVDETVATGDTLELTAKLKTIMALKETKDDKVNVVPLTSIAWGVKVTVKVGATRDKSTYKVEMTSPVETHGKDERNKVVADFKQLGENGKVVWQKVD